MLDILNIIDQELIDSLYESCNDLANKMTQLKYKYDTQLSALQKICKQTGLHATPLSYKNLNNN
jgi:hypothetical protein